MNAWIFDIDGVLTNVYTRKITESSLYPFLAKILNDNDLLAFNTGREIAWIKRVILSPLEELLPDKKFLEHIFIGAEKGGTWEQFGKPEEIDERQILPDSLRQKVKKLITDEFHDSMFFVEGKETMISVEMIDGSNPSLFLTRQEELIPILQRYLDEEGLSSSCKLDPAAIATDIESMLAGKDLGMDHILTWVEEHKHKPNMFYCFGDSPADAHMGNHLEARNLPFQFVYVGNKPLPKDLSFTPTITKEKFDKGTVEYLSSL